MSGTKDDAAFKVFWESLAPIEQYGKFTVAVAAWDACKAHCESMQLAKRMDIVAEEFVKLLWALELAYQYRHAMPEHVVQVLAQRIEDARESC